MSGRGRGRGRGRGAVPPSVAANPFGGHGNTGPSSSGPGGQGQNFVSKTEPGARFPPVSLPQPVDAVTEGERNMVKRAEALTNFMRSSPFYLAPANTQALKVDRYSDKYLTHLQLEERKGKIFAIDTDLTFFPPELQSIYDPEKAKKLASLPQAKASLSFGDALSKLRDLERSEAEAKGAAGGSDEDEAGDNEDEVVYDEEEFEDETDYNFSYFDNGEDDGGYGGDDGDDGPVY